jgi:hypothetical protein
MVEDASKAVGADAARHSGVGISDMLATAPLWCQRRAYASDEGVLVMQPVEARDERALLLSCEK